MAAKVGDGMKRLLGWTIAISFFLALLLWLARWGAETWLESSGGRQVIEAELSKQLGMVVNLGGHYRLRLLPHLTLSGQGLEIRQQASDPPFVSIDSYQASIAWRPFFAGEIRIASVDLIGGQMHLATAAAEGDQQKPDETSPLVLPPIASLSVREFTFPIGRGDVRLVLDRVDLQAFEPGKTTAVQLQGHLDDGQGRVASARVTAAVVVDPESLSVHLAIAAADIEWSAFAYSGLAGSIAWNFGMGNLDGRLVGQNQGRFVDIQWAIRYADLVSGSARVQYREPDWPTAMQAEVEFAAVDGSFEFPGLLLSFDQQSVSGSGCFLLPGPDAEQPSLQILLAAKRLDLDRWLPWVENWLPASDGSRAALSMPDLPMVLAATLRVEHLTWSGAVMEGFEISAGQPPHCTETASTGQN